MRIGQINQILIQLNCERSSFFDQRKFSKDFSSLSQTEAKFIDSRTILHVELLGSFATVKPL